MSKISGGQFASLLLITDAFVLFCLTGEITFLTAVGFLAAAAVQFILAIPAAYYYKKGASFEKLPKIFLLIFLIYMIVWGGSLFVMLWNAAKEISVPSENFPSIPEKFLITGLIAATCLYASSLGIKTLSRSAVIAAALGALYIAVTIISAVSSGKAGNLTAALSTGKFFSEIARGIALSGSSGCFIIFLGFTKGSPIKYAIGYFIGKALLFTAVPLTAAAVAGGVMKIADFPIMLAAEIAQPFSSQRIDSLFLIIFVVLAVYSISIQTAAASYVLGLILPIFRLFGSVFILFAMICASFTVFASLDSYFINRIFPIFALILLPISMKILKKSGGMK